MCVKMAEVDTNSVFTLVWNGSRLAIGTSPRNAYATVYIQH